MTPNVWYKIVFYIALYWWVFAGIGVAAGVLRLILGQAHFQ